MIGNQLGSRLEKMVGPDDRPAASRAVRPQRADSAVRTVDAGELLGSGGLLHIDLDGEIYTLRLTRNHRLILTK